QARGRVRDQITGIKPVLKEARHNSKCASLGAVADGNNAPLAISINAYARSTQVISIAEQIVPGKVRKRANILVAAPANKSP
ncbi:hypothetical protein ABTE14_19880, partial [Acinetobacter baumannii]